MLQEFNCTLEIGLMALLMGRTGQSTRNMQGSAWRLNGFQMPLTNPSFHQSSCVLEMLTKLKQSLVFLERNKLTKALEPFFKDVSVGNFQSEVSADSKHTLLGKL
jgi:hypothetical protein